MKDHASVTVHEWTEKRNWHQPLIAHCQHIIVIWILIPREVWMIYSGRVISGSLKFETKDILQEEKKK